MSDKSFGSIHTNRVTIKKYLAIFQRNKQGSESLMAPRPEFGKQIPHYFVLCQFSEESRNRSYFQSLKNYKTLTEEEYLHERARFEHFWEA